MAANPICPPPRPKKDIRLNTDKVQCQEMRKTFPRCFGCVRFVAAWKPGDLILASRKPIHDAAQHVLFEHHQEAFPEDPVPVVYRPRDMRKQNIIMTNPGPLSDKLELVLNDVVKVLLKHAIEAITTKFWDDHWTLDYAMTAHSTQGLTIEGPRRSGLSTTTSSGVIWHTSPSRACGISTSSLGAALHRMPWRLSLMTMTVRLRQLTTSHSTEKHWTEAPGLQAGLHRQRASCEATV